MAYSTAAEVAAEVKGVVLSGTSTPTDTVVTSWIAEHDAEIDGVVSKRYQTPITGTNALLVIKGISRAMAVGRLREFLHIQTQDAKSSQSRGGDVNPAKAARDRLQAIGDGDLLLTDAVPQSTGQGVSSYVSSNGIAHTFEKDTDQW